MKYTAVIISDYPLIHTFASQKERDAWVEQDKEHRRIFTKKERERRVSEEKKR